MPKNFNAFIKEAEDKAPAPEAPAEAELTPDSAEIALDPRLEKEVFIDSFEINGKTVVIKSLGLGATKPVVVYIDDKRWEIFPGPRIAKREVRRHIKKSPKYAPGGKKFYKVENANIDEDFEALLTEAVNTKYEVQKWIQKNRRKFDNSTEAAFAVADEFGLEDELENEKHWIWDMLKKVYKESYEVPFFEMLELNSFILADGTKIKMNNETSERVKIIYDHLEEGNKDRFRDAFCINKENHNKVMKFVEEQTKGI